MFKLLPLSLKQFFSSQIFFLLALGFAMNIFISNARAQPLTIEVAISDDSVEPGEQFFWSATVSNVSDVTLLEGVFLELPIPEDINSFDVDRISGPRSSISCLSGSSSSNCATGERLQILFGNLNPGESRTVRGPIISLGNALVNTTIDLLFQAGYAGSPGSLFKSEVVKIERPSGLANLEVQIQGEQNPISPGGELTYTLTFGNRGTDQAPGVVLSAILPEGVEFVSASDGGAPSTDRVQWTIGNILPGTGAQRSFTVRDTSGQTGRILLAEAQLLDSNGTEPDARASTTTVLRGNLPLILGVSITSNPAGGFLLTADIENISSTAILENVFLEYRVATQAQGFDTSEVSGPGGKSCLSGSSSSNCVGNERLQVTFGNLAANERRTIIVPFDPFSTLPQGTLSKIRFLSSFTFGPTTPILVDESSILLGELIVPSPVIFSDGFE